MRCGSRLLGPSRDRTHRIPSSDRRRGFQPEKYDEILGLKEKGLGAVVIATAGYRSPEDKYAEAAKVRFEPKDVVIRI